MKKTIFKCISCERIIGVNVEPGNDEKDNIDDNLECITCYNKKDWGSL